MFSLSHESSESTRYTERLLNPWSCDQYILGDTEPMWNKFLQDAYDGFLNYFFLAL